MANLHDAFEGHAEGAFDEAIVLLVSCTVSELVYHVSHYYSFASFRGSGHKAHSGPSQKSNHLDFHVPRTENVISSTVAKKSGLLAELERGFPLSPKRVVIGLHESLAFCHVFTQSSLALSAEKSVNRSYCFTIFEASEISPLPLCRSRVGVTEAPIAGLAIAASV